MRYIIGILVCGSFLFAYFFLCSAIGWTSGGGVLPMLIILVINGFIWRGITRKNDSEKKGDKNE